jgi:hypothetical protein
MTNLEYACKHYGWAGGTIHQVAQKMGMAGRGAELASMGFIEFIVLFKEKWVDY